MSPVFLFISGSATPLTYSTPRFIIFSLEVVVIPVNVVSILFNCSGSLETVISPDPPNLSTLDCVETFIKSVWSYLFGKNNDLSWKYFTTCVSES